MSEIYEKLGAFYLGREVDFSQQQTDALPGATILYDSRDLVTHAVIVGMTGSGKTGLGITLLEEAAIDGIPALVIDPKGDMANLLLNFPELRPEQFEPWVNVDEAVRADKPLREYAAEQAQRWREGLQAWDQDGARIQRLRDSVELTIYTPGSDAGIPISIVSSFVAPSSQVLENRDLLSDRVATTATSLLTLLGIDADPIRSREHILLATLLHRAWQAQESLSLPDLIRQVQSPPVQTIGVMDVESFFPAKERFEFAMTLNNLLAAPGFASWMTGEPLDVGRLLYDASGKPRVGIFTLSHLPESERMFFVSLLLNEVIVWMRSRPGTASLRAILYIDEVFGYMPPVAEPPTKRLLLTLLKQARAYGLGIVLATQNPVDLDYKGLSNTGTWFLGRLQTEQDRERVLDGLERAMTGTAAHADRTELRDVLGSLGKRVFLMHNVHEDRAVTFQTRWALSYLAGPMTRAQIERLMAPRKQTMEQTAAPSVPEESLESAVPPALAETRQLALPPLSPKIDQFVLSACSPTADHPIVYRPRLLAIASVHHVRPRIPTTADEDLAVLTPIGGAGQPIDWERAEVIPSHQLPLQLKLAPAQALEEIPAEATKPTNYTRWRKQCANYLYRTRRYMLFHSKLLDETSQPGESERDFRIRLLDQLHERRDEAVAKLRKKYARKISQAERQVRRAEQRLDRERSQASGAGWQSAISIGATLLSSLLGRKSYGSRTLGRATTAARSIDRSVRQREDVQRAFRDIRIYEDRLMELERELEREVQELSSRMDPMTWEFGTIQLKPRRTDIDIRSFGLAWAPFFVIDDQTMEPAYRVSS